MEASQETLVVVVPGGAGLTVIVTGLVVELEPWEESVGVYEPETLAVPTADALKFTRHVAEPGVPEDIRVQLVLSKLPDAPVEEKLTVPAGVIIPPRPVSLTVAVQAEVPLTNIGLSQPIDVTVGRGFTLMVAVVVP